MGVNAEYMGTHPIFESDFDCLTGIKHEVDSSTAAPSYYHGCARIRQGYHFRENHGDMLRAQVEKGSGVGKEAKRFMDGGQLVPDHLVTKIVINEIPEGAFLLDGSRTVVQAEELGNAVEV